MDLISIRITAFLNYYCNILLSHETFQLPTELDCFLCCFFGLQRLKPEIQSWAVCGSGRLVTLLGIYSYDFMVQGWSAGEEFNTGRLESKIEGRIRFGRELLGICLPVGQKDWFQSPIEREIKARSCKIRSDKGYVRFWEQIVLLQDILWSETESEWEPFSSHEAHPQTHVPRPQTQCTLNPFHPGWQLTCWSHTVMRVRVGQLQSHIRSLDKKAEPKNMVKLFPEHMCTSAPNLRTPRGN